jgi:cytidine deaminase
MKTKFTFDYDRYESWDELPEADRELAKRAREACQSSFSPFSKFRVGVAARLRSGFVMTASNQESEVFPEGMCAERILLWNWQVHHSGDPIEAIALVSEPDARECYPCGGCRQVMLDTEARQGSPIRVVMCSESSVSVVGSARDLIPFQFVL